MTNEEIAEKYGIEPIMKEMWVWDTNETYAVIMFVVVKDTNTNFPYVSYSKNNVRITFRNASETNPNEKEPKVGDKGYFWDDETNGEYLYAKLTNIEDFGAKYDTYAYGIYEHFSHEKQSWMK
jgi:hypothetical protein